MSKGTKRKSSITWATLAIAVAATAAASAQPATRAKLSGILTSVDADAKHLSLKSDNGDDVSVTITDRTVLLRIPAGETDPKKGRVVVLATLSAGDRAVVIGPAPAGPKDWAATTVLVMSRSDVAQMQQKDQDDWRKRGVSGTVTAIDAGAGTVTITSGSRTLTLLPSDKTSYQRYSPDSARFADARPSSIAEIRTGDQVRVLGNKGADAVGDPVIRAEKIISGSFRQIAATITAIHLQSGELTVKDLATKKPLIIKIDANSEMRKLSEQAGRMLARRYARGAPQGENAGVDIGQMLDHLPVMPISELKPGDAVMVCTTQGTDPGRVTAITLLAGVEPLLTASPTATRDIMGGWNPTGGGDGGQ